MSSVLKFLIAFLALTGATTLVMQFTNIELGQENYWENRGVFFLFFVTLFPRLTLLFSSVTTGGIFWWLGFIFAPRFLVAILATLAYWESNPILVVFSWLIAISGESGEKHMLGTQVRFVKTGGRPFSRESFRQNDDAIETEYRELK